MKRTGFYNQGIEGAEAIEPSKITAGQKYDTGLVYIYPATNSAIDDVNDFYTGWIIFNESLNRWQEARSEAIGRHVIKRIRVSIGSSGGDKKGVSFSYGTSILNPFFALAITSSNNNDAFCVKVISITATSAYLEVYRADGSSWGDATLACMVTIYTGTY